MLKLSRNVRGRGFFAPALIACPKVFLVHLGGSSGGYAFLSAGVVAAALSEEKG